MSLAALPYDLLIDQLLPSLSLSGLLALTCTSREFAVICTDPILWKRKLEKDFNYFPSSEITRISGFKAIFKGIYRPKVYIWGHLANGRRGLENHKTSNNKAYPHPVLLEMKQRIVSLSSGGWSFHALDASGAIHVWGTLNGAAYARSPLYHYDPSFAGPGDRASVPMKLGLPCRFISISCGRAHSAALDTEHRVWIFTRWGRPMLLTFTGTLDNPSERHPRISHTKIVQVDCGYLHFVAFLTDDGQVFATWISHALLRSQTAQMNEASDGKNDGYPDKAVNGVIPCIPFTVEAEPVRLPDIPSDLPNLCAGVVMRVPQGETPKLIKIAAGSSYIIGLTNQGHILFIDVKGGNLQNGVEVVQEQFLTGVRRWTYLPKFCELGEIATDSLFVPGEDGVPRLIPPNTLNITHISCHWESFLLHSTGGSNVVLLAKLTRTRLGFEFVRLIYPTLHEREIVSVTASESHYAALDADGTLLTWGVDQFGSLGLGELGRDWNREWTRFIVMEQPKPVQFQRDSAGRRMICIAMTTGGWQSGALVFELDGSEDRNFLLEGGDLSHVGRSADASLIKGKSAEVEVTEISQEGSNSSRTKWRQWRGIFGSKKS